MIKNIGKIDFGLPFAILERTYVNPFVPEPNV